MTHGYQPKLGPRPPTPPSTRGGCDCPCRCRCDCPKPAIKPMPDPQPTNVAFSEPEAADDWSRVILINTTLLAFSLGLCLGLIL